MPGDHFRSTGRRPVSLPASLADLAGGFRTDTSIVDLGLGGAGLLARGVPAVGTAVRIEVISPSLWDPLSLDGEVRWSLPPDGRGTSRLGIAFLHRRAGRLRALLELIASAAYD